jgi:uracil-DNA glycosylase
MVDVNIERSWKNHLKRQFTAPYMVALLNFLKEEKLAGKDTYPPSSKIFNAFNLTKFSSIKVIILGQDPYHGPSQADGLSFSVKRIIAPPPSLKNIFKELYSDLNINHPNHGDLTAWARQGVLLLNTCLTVEKGLPNSHKGRGWERFTDNVLSRISDKKKHVVFILWGRKAQEKEKFIDSTKHLIIKSAHPSPLSAYNGFFGSKPFSKANLFLKQNNLRQINWDL